MLCVPDNERGRNVAVVERGLEGHVADMYGEVCITTFLQTYGAVVFEQIQAEVCGTLSLKYHGLNPNYDCRQLILKKKDL